MNFRISKISSLMWSPLFWTLSICLIGAVVGEDEVHCGCHIPTACINGIGGSKAYSISVYKLYTVISSHGSGPQYTGGRTWEVQFHHQYSLWIALANLANGNTEQDHCRRKNEPSRTCLGRSCNDRNSGWMF